MAISLVFVSLMTLTFDLKNIAIQKQHEKNIC